MAATLDPAIEVFRSTRRAECAERAFMLAAVGINSETYLDGQFCRLTVDGADAARAGEQLAQYELERRPSAPPPQRVPSYPHAWLGCVIYVGVLTMIALGVSNGLGRLDAFDAGELDAGRVQAGQWWRAWTALTLHLDGAHLVANLGGGVWFGYLASRRLGAGHAWFLTVTGAACANLLEALLGPPTHHAVGASTAVFTALGILSAHAWRLRAHETRRWALQWAPLVGGLVLLGWTGTGSGDGDAGQIDIVAHGMGFAVGALLGALAAWQGIQRWLQHVPQWASGLAALAEIAAAWSMALTS